MIVDMRCPRCNSTIQGREEVAIRKTLPKKNCECPRCKTPVRLIETKDDDSTLPGVQMFHFTVA